jgi:hypothetical protein
MRIDVVGTTDADADEDEDAAEVVAVLVSCVTVDVEPESETIARETPLEKSWRKDCILDTRLAVSDAFSPCFSEAMI